MKIKAKITTINPVKKSNFPKFWNQTFCFLLPHMIFYKQKPLENKGLGVSRRQENTLKITVRSADKNLIAWLEFHRLPFTGCILNNIYMMEAIQIGALAVYSMQYTIAFLLYLQNLDMKAGTKNAPLH